MDGWMDVLACGRDWGVLQSLEKYSCLMLKRKRKILAAGRFSELECDTSMAAEIRA
jgi:hypothetical protein